MSHNTLLDLDHNRLVVKHDTEDDVMPLSISVWSGDDDAWLDPEDIARLIAVLTPFATPSETPQPVAASDISLNEGVIRLAAVHGAEITFRYAKGASSAVESRTLRPTSIEVAGGHTIFRGLSPDRDGEFRTFRLDRIKGVVTL